MKMLTRRTLIGCTALTGLGATGGAQAAPSVMVIYVSTWDCTYCRVWDKTLWPDFQASPEFQRIDWKKINAKSIKTAYEDQYWPQELRRYRDEAALSGGLPRWLIVKDGRLVFNGRGSVKGSNFTQDYPDWKAEVLPALKVALS